MKVETHSAGSICVVWNTKNHYIDVRKDVRRPHLSFIEVVKNGRVYIYDTVDNIFAPERIIYYIKQEFV